MDDAAAAKRWMQWEEVVVSNDRGRRLVHYYLRGAGGASGGEERELAVVGRERSPRHMSYAVQGRFLRSLAAAGDGSASPSPSQSPAAAEGAPRKWRSRREVVDWLSSLVSGCNDGTYSMANRFHGNSYDDNGADFVDVAAPMVHNFVYIMSEEKNRLIAYVEDLYEDSNALNMVMVRWFDKVDEDSGIMGCWFRCLILKRHRDKIKVRYQDLQNAEDTGNLEEWVLLTRIAKPDQLGIRISGRPMVRPRHVMQDSKDPCSLDIVPSLTHGGIVAGGGYCIAVWK
ncbi:hypothetical protein ACQ4PT_015715 [Festuca glaucescens]